MGNIALWVKTEKAMIAAGVPRDGWQQYVNEAVLFALARGETLGVER